jgi:cardiolipin synthase (CMP-forming)
MSETRLKQRLARVKEQIEQKIALLVPSRVHPNHLTSFRLAVILLLPVAEFYALSAMIVFWLAVLGAVSDSLDGITARQRHQITPLGTTLDPIADKLFAVVCFIILWRRDMISPNLITWMLILESHLVVIPVLSFIYRLLGGKPIQRETNVRPNIFGKAKMVVISSGFCLMFMGRAYEWLQVIPVGRFFIYAGLVLSGMALINYLLEWITEKY